MQVINLSEHNSVLNQYLREIRDVHIQKDSLRFRRNIERIGEVMAIEVSKTLNYEPTDVQTPLGVAHVNTISDNIVLATILRAGLPGAARGRRCRCSAQCFPAAVLPPSRLWCIVLTATPAA